MLAVYLTLATAVIALVTLLIGIIWGRKKLDAIHVIVNSRYTELVKRVAMLIAALKEHGIDVPNGKDDNVGLYLLALVPDYR
jgi:hypothetical protein